MFDLKKLSVGGVAILLLATMLLAGCGHLTNAEGASAAGTPNTSAPTITSGPVTIGTDHSAYNGADIMKVTITNHLTSVIYAYDSQASCSIVSLQVKQNGQWIASNALPCMMGRVTMRVEIKAGEAYTFNVGGASQLGGGHGLADGTYRLVLRYFASLPGTEKTPALNEVDSAALTISHNIAPSNTPAPVGTSGGSVIKATPPSGKPSGTPAAG